MLLDPPAISKAAMFEIGVSVTYRHNYIKSCYLYKSANNVSGVLLYGPSCYAASDLVTLANDLPTRSPFQKKADAD